METAKETLNRVQEIIAKRYGYLEWQHALDSGSIEVFIEEITLLFYKERIRMSLPDEDMLESSFPTDTWGKVDTNAYNIRKQDGAKWLHRKMLKEANVQLKTYRAKELIVYDKRF